jgi:hypothetical protein
MKKLLILAALTLLPLGAQATTPEDFFNNFFEFILNNIQKDKTGNIDTTKKVILQENAAGNIILGRLFLNKNTNSADAVSFPQCGPNKKNKRADRLRLKVAEAAAYIDKVKITYQNGASEVANVNDNFAKGENSGWYDLKGNNRCIQKIRVTGHAKGGANVTYTVITFVGRISN